MAIVMESALKAPEGRRRHFLTPTLMPEVIGGNLTEIRRLFKKGGFIYIFDFMFMKVFIW
jgi:hypothetical protein